MASRAITKDKKVTSSSQPSRKPTTVQQKKTTNSTATTKTTSTETKNTRPSPVSSSIPITKKQHVPEKTNARRSIDKSPSPSLRSPLRSPSPVTRGRLHSPSPTNRDRLRSPSPSMRSPSPVTRGRLRSPSPATGDRLRSPSPSMRSPSPSIRERSPKTSSFSMKAPHLSKSKDAVKSPPVPKPQKPKSPSIGSTKKQTRPTPKLAPKSKPNVYHQQRQKDQNTMILEQDFEKIQHGDDSDFTHEIESEDGGYTTHSERSPMTLEDDHEIRSSRDGSDVGSQSNESFEEKETDNLQYELELESEHEQEPESNLEIEYKEDPEQEAKPDVENNSKPSPKTDQKSEPTLDTESEMQPILEPELDSKPEVESEPEPESEPDPEPEHKPESESSPKPEMEHELEPKLEQESNSEHGVEDNPQPKDEEEMDTKNMEEEIVVLEDNRKGEGGGNEPRGRDTEVGVDVVKSTELKDTAAYNNVIEETVSKLREKKINKVSALVGAFETVISLESE